MAVYSLYDGKWLTEDFEPWVVAYYFREWHGYSMKPHYHDRVEIMYVIAGSALVEVMKTRLVMDKGDFILIDAGVSHRLEVAKTCRMLNIEFVFRERTTCCPAGAGRPQRFSTGAVETAGTLPLQRIPGDL